MEVIKTPNQGPFKRTDLLSERNLPLGDFRVAEKLKEKTAECVSEALCYCSVHKKENSADQPLPNSFKPPVLVHDVTSTATSEPPPDPFTSKASTFVSRRVSASLCYDAV